MNKEKPNVHYVVLMLSEISYQRGRRHYNAKSYPSLHLAELGLEQMIIAFRRNPNLYDNDWAVRYFVYKKDMNNNTNTIVHMGRHWRVPAPL